MGRLLKVFRLKDDVGGLEEPTLTDAGELNFTLKISTNAETVAIKPKAVQLTGTTAGTAKLQRSLEGTDWEDVTGIDLTLADGAFTIWELNVVPCPQYRINVVGSGTQTSTITVDYYMK